MPSGWSYSTCFCSVSFFWATILNRNGIPYRDQNISGPRYFRLARQRILLHIDYTGSEDKSDRL